MVEHRVLLVGHGMISSRYIDAFGGLPQARIVGVVGRDQERAATYAQQQGIAYADTNLKAAAEETKATAVVVCTPNGVHDQAVFTAAELGLHCLCEKPLHIDPDTQDEMVNRCRQHGVKLGVSFMRRFTPHIRYVKQLIDRGALGELKVIDAVLKHYRLPEYYSQSTWHGTYAIDGGGPFIQQAIHLVDLALWLGGEVQEVTAARMFQAVHDIETEDHGYAWLTYKNGAIGMIETSTACHGMNEEYLAISGTKGSIVLDFNGIKHFEVEGRKLDEAMSTAGDSSLEIFKDLFHKLVEDFIRSIEEDRDPFVSGESATGAVRLVDDIYKKAGPPVRL